MTLTPIANVPGSSQMAGTKVPQHIIIVDSSGNVIDSFGGSVTQYTEGDTDTTITGIAMMWEDTGDTLRSVNDGKRLPVRTGREGAASRFWSTAHIPSANTKATITQASAGAGVRNVCTGLTVSLASSSTTAPAAIQLSVSLIDGASGGTTYLWRTNISLPATAGAISGFALSGLWIPGSQATGMTIEFSAAGGANTVESVSIWGTTVTE